MPIAYLTNQPLDLDAVIDLYRASTLGERRPIEDRAVMAQMLEHANLIITAWDDERLVGIARSLTDWGYCCYLADLAVHADYQRQGIGRQLVHRIQAELGPRVFITLLAAPAAAAYYPHIGMTQHPSAWLLRPDDTP